MFWEIKFSTLGVVTKMEKYNVAIVNHVITEKLRFLKPILKIKQYILDNYRFPRIGFLIMNPLMTIYQPINTAPTMPQYIQFSNP